MNIIEVSNLIVKYDTKTILSNISFNVAAGEIFFIIGGSGCGKTTLLNHLIGLQDPSCGKIFINGKNLLQAKDKERLAILCQIGVLYQNNALFGSMNLLENVELPLTELTALPKDASEIIAHNKLKMVGLGNFANYLPAEISGGMQKRVGIARAMALDPAILFLDEPSAGLDPINAAQLDVLLLGLSQALNITLVIVSHDLASIYNIAQRVIMLHEGKVIAEGKPKILVEQSDNMLVKKFLKRAN